MKREVPEAWVSVSFFAVIALISVPGHALISGKDGPSWLLLLPLSIAEFLILAIVGYAFTALTRTPLNIWLRYTLAAVGVCCAILLVIWGIFAVEKVLFGRYIDTGSMAPICGALAGANLARLKPRKPTEDPIARLPR